MARERFKIGTFNLYNLVLPKTYYYGRRMYSSESYEKKVDWIAGQLGRMDADLVGFQEIFHRAALAQVIDHSGIYPQSALVTGQERPEGPVVGLLSRFPVLESEFVLEFPTQARLEMDGVPIPLTTFSRPVLCARVELPTGHRVMVFVVHLKSKNPMIRDGADDHDPMERAIGKARSLIRRAAEATAVRCLLLDRLKGNDDPVVILGDINDTGQAVTSEIIAGSPPWRTLPLKVKKGVWDVLLYNVNDIQARQSYRDIYYTHIHNGHYESLDHILVSQEFVNQNPDHIGIVEYVRVYNDHLVDDTLSADKIPAWQSDHGQVTVTIRLD
ncbi:MAG: endonuclease/exonuclease/phosphatase family protein [Anaerolineae bacterium]|nr:endonuclease/exonuclease/phosphatase family protein [Anaerolineae bacterium]